MATQQHGMLTDDDLNDTDRRVLAVLAEGRVTPQFVADEINVSRTYASERLKRLTEHAHVQKVAPGLYELVDDPREGGDE
jgi:predicted transcriptional regulator